MSDAFVCSYLWVFSDFSNLSDSFVCSYYLLSVFLQICFVRFVSADSIRFFSFVCSYLFVQMYICAVSFDQILVCICWFIFVCWDSFFGFVSWDAFLFRFVMFRFVFVEIILQILFKSVNFETKSLNMLEKCKFENKKLLILAMVNST